MDLVELTPGDWYEVGYCAPRGIPLSIFRGRVPAPGEPHWLPLDRAAALAWHERELTRCPGCGLDQRETTDAGNDDKYTAEGVRCHACKAKDQAARDFADNTDADPLAGMLFRVRHDDEV